MKLVFQKVLMRRLQGGSRFSLWSFFCLVPEKEAILLFDKKSI
jgi:hypothetical protein